MYIIFAVPLHQSDGSKSYRHRLVGDPTKKSVRIGAEIQLSDRRGWSLLFRSFSG